MIRLSSGGERNARRSVSGVSASSAPLPLSAELKFGPTSDSRATGRAEVGPKYYFVGWGATTDSWWNIAIHLPFFFVHTVDTQTGLGMACP